MMIIHVKWSMVCGMWYSLLVFRMPRFFLSLFGSYNINSRLLHSGFLIPDFRCQSLVSLGIPWIRDRLYEAAGIDTEDILIQPTIYIPHCMQWMPFFYFWIFFGKCSDSVAKIVWTSFTILKEILIFSWQQMLSEFSCHRFWELFDWSINFTWCNVVENGIDGRSFKRWKWC